MNYVRQTVISNEKCKKYNPKVLENQICVSSIGRKYPTFGDSGGPLIVSTSENFSILIGVLSAGSPEGSEQGAPVIYTRVTSYLKWIKDHTYIAY